MAITPRFVALTLVAAVSAGVGTWVAVRYLVKPPPRAPERGGRRAGRDRPRAAGSRRRCSTSPPTACGCRRPSATWRTPTARPTRPSGSSRRCSRRRRPGWRAPSRRARRCAASTSAEGGAAYVDFTAALRANHPGGSLNEILTVYAIVSSLTANLPAITAVQILIDGHEADTLAGHVDLRRPLPPSALWTEKGPS